MRASPRHRWGRRSPRSAEPCCPRLGEVGDAQSTDPGEAEGRREHVEGFRLSRFTAATPLFLSDNDVTFTPQHAAKPRSLALLFQTRRMRTRGSSHEVGKAGITDRSWVGAEVVSSTIRARWRSIVRRPTNAVPCRAARRSGSVAWDGVRLAYAIHEAGHRWSGLVLAQPSPTRLAESSPGDHFLDQLGEIATVVRLRRARLRMSHWTIDDLRLRRACAIWRRFSPRRAGGVRSTRDVRRFGRRDAYAIAHRTC